MKIQVEDKEKVFIPFKFTVEIETKEEAVKFLVLLNHVKINNALGLHQGFETIRAVLKEEADIKFEDYQNLFQKLENLIK